MLARTALAAAAATTVAAAMMAQPAVAGGDHFRLLTAKDHGSQHALRWNPCQDEITVKVNVKLAQARGAPGAKARRQAKAELRTAIKQVAAETGLPLRYKGTTSIVPRGDWYERQDADAEIVAAYVRPGSGGGMRSDLIRGGAWGTGGQAWQLTGDGVVVGRGFVVLDAAKARNLRPGFGEGNRRGNLVLHEFGHVLGLDHVDDPHQLMNPMLTEHTPDGFAAGDRAGLAKLDATEGCIAGASEAWAGS